MMVLITLFFITTSSLFAAVPLSDNILFAFEKCRALSVDLKKGQLKEEILDPFDIHCQKIPDDKLSLKCTSFEATSNKKISENVYSGGSDLGVGELKDSEGRKIHFILGKGFAAYDSPNEHKVCIGIYLFEKDALKKAKSP